jgi:hypothetical protein
MNIIEKIISLFAKPAEKVKEEDLIVTEAVDPTTLNQDQLKKDMEALGKLDEKIAHTENLTKAVVVEDNPEYVDGLTIKNPFVGE